MARAPNPGLATQAAEDNSTYVESAWGGCPISGIGTPQFAPPTMTSDDDNCLALAISSVESMIASIRPDVLLMTEHGSAVSPLLVDGRIVEPLTAEHDQRLVDAYVAVFERFLVGVDRIVLLETNQDGLPVGCRGSNSTPGAACTPNATTVDAIARYNSVLNTVAQHFQGRVAVISLADIVCPRGTCLPIRDGMLIRYDGQHYTATFSRWIAPQLLARIADASAMRFVRAGS